MWTLLALYRNQSIIEIAKTLTWFLVCVIKFAWPSYKCSVYERFITRCFTTAFMSVDEDMLRYVWKEFDYLIDISNVTRSSHIEQL
jgi:hypothetical protein